MALSLTPYSTYWVSPRCAPDTPLIAQAESPPKTIQNIDNKQLKDFFQELFAFFLKGNGKPIFTGGGISTGDAQADWSWILRTIMLLTSYPEAPALESTGLTTGENFFRGAWAAVKAWERFKASYLAGDTAGMVESGIDIVRGVCQSIGGGFYVAYRFLMIAADVKNINTAFNAATPLGKAAFAVGTIGNIFFTLFYIAIGVFGVQGLYENTQFMNGLEACKDDPKELAKYLKEKSRVDIASELDKFKKDSKHKEQCIDSALDKMADLLYASGITREMQGGGVCPSKERLKDYLKDQLAAHYDAGGALHGEISSLMGLQGTQVAGLSLLELVAFKFEMLKLQCQKGLEMGRVTGKASQQVAKAFSRGIEVRLETDLAPVKKAAKKEMKVLQENVTGENKANKILHVVLIAIGILGLVSSIIGFFPVLAPAMAMALIVTTLLLCIAMAGLDGYCMATGWGSGEPGRYDKHYIAFLASMIVVSVAISIGVTLGCGLPIIPLICAGIFASVGLGLCGVAWDELSHKERKWYWEHPKLENFSKMADKLLSSEDSDAKVHKLFKALPKADRRAVREKYIDLSKSAAWPRFADPRYAKWNAHNDFGGAYFNEYLNGSLDKKNSGRFFRGIKKTRSFYWEKWENAKTEENKALALEVELLYALTKKIYTLEGQSENETVITKINRVRAQLKELAPRAKAASYYSRLKQDLWYVASREENEHTLKVIVSQVLADKQKGAAQAAAGSLPKKKSFSDLVLKAFDKQPAAAAI